MGDYDPRGSTDEYGRPKDPESEPEPQTSSSPPPPGPSPEPEQTVHGTDGHALASKDDRTMAMFCHLGAAIVVFFSAMFGFAVPLIIWLMKKDESEFVDDQGKEALNFQITIAIANFANGLLIVITCMIWLIPAILVAIALWVFAVIMGIIAAIKANEGERYRYPFCWRLIN